ncbi:MAG: sensor domain-containing diguanylate cyclase [Deltaproteobacteria bacterium]|nr:sensor domain-containing diguanylate cyclase [Deltaproteobacteria bacterium]
MESVKGQNRSEYCYPADTGELQRKRLQVTTFNEIGKALTSSLDLREVLNIVMDKIRELLHPKNWSLLLLNEEARELRFEIVVGPGSEKIKDLRLKLGEGVAGWVARERRPLLVADVSKDPRFWKKADEVSNFTTQSIICVPLVTRGKCLGVIELINEVEEKSFVEDDLLVLTTLADYTAIAIENAIFFNRVQELTITDDLTKLYNSRFLHSRLEYEVERAKRFKNPVSMIFLDLDFFKEVNDSFGHLRGSQLLKEVAQLIIGLIRNVDMACRYGGDEFIIMMPETQKENAVVVAEKIRVAIREATFLRDDGINVRLTGSFGVACFPEDACDKDGLIQMADNAMYKVKTTTKDGVAKA